MTSDSNNQPTASAPAQGSQQHPSNLNTTSTHQLNHSTPHQQPHQPAQTTPSSGKSKHPKSGKKKTGATRSMPRFSKQEVDSKGIPIDYKDPISQLIMSDPVSTAAGSTYERESIERWLDSSDVDPITGTKLKSKLVYPNNALKNQISLFLEAQPKFKQFVCTQGEYTLERIENLLKDDHNIHEITKLIRKAATLTKKETKQNILHIVFAHSCCVGYIEKILEQKVIQDQLSVLLSQRDSEGNLPMTSSLQNSSFEVFKYTVNKYFTELMAEPESTSIWNDENKQKHLAEHIMDCCSEGFLNGIIILKHFGIPLDYKLEDSNFYPIEEAAYGGHPDVMTYIYNNCNVPLEHLNKALGSAAEGHHIDSIKFCLEKGADINYSDKNPVPLARAVHDLPTVMFLVENGAKINVETPSTFDGEPTTPLSAAAQADEYDASEESLKVMDYLIENGANIDYQDDRGWAAIHYAVRARNKKAIGKLIENECNVDLLTSDKQSVYDIADEFADSEVIGDEDSISEGEAGEEDIPFLAEDGVEEIYQGDVVPLSPSTGHVGHTEDDPEQYVYLDNDGIILSDEDENITEDEFSAQAIKDFIREHSALVKRLRQSMMKRDISNISKGMSHLEQKYDEVVNLVSIQSELIKRLCEKSNIDVDVEALQGSPQTETIEDSLSRKRKRKKVANQKNKKKRMA